jgi:osmotically inducible protein OsmC
MSMAVTNRTRQVSDRSGAGDRGRGTVCLVPERPRRVVIVAAESKATTVWQGGLTDGSGTVAPDSGAFGAIEVSWARRVEREGGLTSPEELLAAAHASCYCMALSHELGQAGNPPERLEATATVSFVPGEGVKSSNLVVKGTVPGIDAEAFSAAAKAAADGCPISGALKGNVDIGIEATLDS